MRSLTAKLLLVTSLFTSAASIAQPHFAQPPGKPAPVAQDPVVDIYVVANRDTVRAALVQARATNLQAFRDYQAAGVFPSNTFKDKSLNVWRDRDGHFCAAATIIRQSGLVELTDKVAKDSNFIKLADVKSGELMDWILTSGFTQGEIAQIQEPFMPVYREKPAVQPDMRSAENSRLRARYTVVTNQLVKDANASLDAATTLLLKNPELASRFVNQYSTID